MHLVFLNNPMGLDHLQMAPLVPDDSLLCFFLLTEKILCCNTKHFSSGISSTI